MIFWTLLILTVLIAIGAALATDSYGSPTLNVVMALLCGGFFSFFIIMACGSWIPWNNDVVKDDTYKLRTIGTETGVSGRSYFLGGGYIDSKRFLNYISDAGGGAINVRMAPADRSTIYEDAPTGTGSVQIKHIDHVNGWVAPWPLGSHDEYVFRIPAGSIADNFQGVK